MSAIAAVKGKSYLMYDKSNGQRYSGKYIASNSVFGHRSSSLISKEKEDTGIIADNQIN